MKRIMALIAAAFVAMTAFVGCDTPTIPNNDPVEISTGTLWDSVTGAIPGTVPTQYNPVNWTDSGVTSNGIVWTVESVYTKDSWNKLYKVHTNRYESGSTEQITWYVFLSLSGTDWAPADLGDGYGPCGSWTDTFVTYAISKGYPL